MRPSRLSLLASVAVFSLAACTRTPAGPPSPDASLPEPTTDAGSAPDAGVSSTSFTLQYGLQDAGMEPIPLVREEEGRPIIEPTSGLELHSSMALRNYRVRLFDESDRALVSDDTAEETPSGLLYRLTLPAPLKAGHRYTLVVDAQTGTAMLDAQGREVADLRAAFQIAGEKEKSPPPAAKKHSRH